MHQVRHNALNVLSNVSHPQSHDLSMILKESSERLYLALQGKYHSGLRMIHLDICIFEHDYATSVIIPVTC